MRGKCAVHKNSATGTKFKVHSNTENLKTFGRGRRDYFNHHSLGLCYNPKVHRPILKKDLSGLAHCFF